MGSHELAEVELRGYACISTYCRPSGRKGGTAIYVRLGLAGEEVSYLVELSVQHVCEIAAVEIKEFNIICIEVYRVPDENNFDAFIETMYNMLDILNSKNKSHASVILVETLM